MRPFRRRRRPGRPGSAGDRLGGGARVVLAAGTAAVLTIPVAPTVAAAAPPASRADHRTLAAPTPRAVPVRVRVPNGNGAAPFDQPRTLTVPRGWTAEVWARVPGARFAVWTPGHQLLVSVPSAGTVVALRPGRRPGAVPHQTVLLSGLTEPQGLAFDTLDGRRVLYVAESDQLERYRWRAGAPVAPSTVAGRLPDTDPAGDDVHRVKEVAVGPDHTVYVDVGSASNADPADRSTTPPRAVIMAYPPDGGGRVYATGVRNGDGLSFDPEGELWTAVNERDNIPYPFHRPYDGYDDGFGRVIGAYVDDHPADVLARVDEGRDLGWPYCDPDPDVHPGMAGTARRYADVPFDPDAATNPGGANFDCSHLAPVERGIPAHSAPLGLDFLQGSRLPGPWSNGAVVAAHGSWNRTSPRPPAVLWFPWQPRRETLGRQVSLVRGFQHGGSARWGRPVDAVPGPDGALYVTDDTAGAVYRFVPRPARTPPVPDPARPE